MAAARRRTILALDCDCFYAQCEVRRDASLEGKPVGVRQKMLVITSNYAARAHGIKKGDSLAEVKRKCPDIVIKDGEDISHYTEVSNAWRAYVDKYRRPSGYSSDESRRRRGRDVDIPRSRRRRDLAIPWRRVATPPRPRRGYSMMATTPRPGYSVETSRDAAAAATWIFHDGNDAATWLFRGDESRRHRGRDVDIPWSRRCGRDLAIPR